MQKTTNKTYAYAALLLHATKQSVTKDKIAAIFAALGLTCCPKTASLFELPSDKYANMLTCTSAAPAGPVVAQSTSAPAADEPAKKKESDSESVPFDF